MAIAGDHWTKAGQRFMKELKELQQFRVCVGFQNQGKRKPEKKKHSKGKKRKVPEEDKSVTNLDVAMWNELGTVRSPSRPFMRNSVDNNIAIINDVAAAAVKQIAHGASAKNVLTTLGALQVGLMQDEITEGQFVPNAPSTIRRKKSDKPLVDTGQMRQSIHFVIKKKGDG